MSEEGLKLDAVLAKDGPCRETVIGQLRQLEARASQYAKAAGFLADAVEKTGDKDIEPAVYELMSALRLWELLRR